MSLTQDTKGYAGNTKITKSYITNITITDFAGGVGENAAITAKGLDTEDDRGEAFRILLNGIYASSGAIAVVGPDYIEPSLSIVGYPNKHRPRGRYYRD